VDPVQTTTEERRTPAPAFTLLDGLAVEILVPLAGDHLVFSGRVVQLTETTVTVALDDGPTALSVAMCRRCVLVWGEEGVEQCALVRNGRRVDDVHSPTTIELVLEEVRPLTDVIE
jgi:hypothetical protein